MKALLEVVGHLWSQKTHTFLQRARRPQEASYICCGQTEKRALGLPSRCSQTRMGVTYCSHVPHSITTELQR